MAYLLETVPQKTVPENYIVEGYLCSTTIAHTSAVKRQRSRDWILNISMKACNDYMQDTQVRNLKRYIITAERSEAAHYSSHPLVFDLYIVEISICVSIHVLIS